MLLSLGQGSQQKSVSFRMDVYSYLNAKNSVVKGRWIVCEPAAFFRLIISLSFMGAAEGEKSTYEVKLISNTTP